ncbi:hypothetical protein FNJ87_08395 [Nonlabens mediterrranea]|uniref:Uncharacterized protein n=1 Tax=Nonlabens mediterrranea TaxID=1419947 RepID=A0ABS0A6X3_9FLAO|nr:hypothetical protein [Nonlabens mediterrranea]
MRSTTFNICPTCIHHKKCVLTDQHQSVWSCSDYDEKIKDSTCHVTQVIEPVDQLKLEMV